MRRKELRKEEETTESKGRKAMKERMEQKKKGRK